MNEYIKSVRSTFGKMMFTRRKSLPNNDMIVSKKQEKNTPTDLEHSSKAQGRSNSVQTQPENPDLFQRKAKLYKKQKTRKKSSPCEAKISKKDMMTDWNASYEKMCQRAEILNLAIKTAEKDELAVKPVTRFTTEAGQGSKRCKTFFSVHSVSSAGIDNSQDCGGTGTSEGTTMNIKDDRDKCRYLYDTQSLDGIEI